MRITKCRFSQNASPAVLPKLDRADFSQTSAKRPLFRACTGIKDEPGAISMGLNRRAPVPRSHQLFQEADLFLGQIDTHIKFSRQQSRD
jgi:hypothetical protein